MDLNHLNQLTNFWTAKNFIYTLKLKSSIFFGFQFKLSKRDLWLVFVFSYFQRSFKKYYADWAKNLWKREQIFKDLHCESLWSRASGDSCQYHWWLNISPSSFAPSVDQSSPCFCKKHWKYGKFKLRFKGKTFEEKKQIRHVFLWNIVWICWPPASTIPKPKHLIQEYRKSCKIREKNAVSGVFLANLKIMTTSSDMKKSSSFPTSRLAYPWFMFSLPAMVKFCFSKSTETWSTKSGDPSVYPKSAPVCSSASWHRSEHSMSHPPTVVAGHLFGGWVFWRMFLWQGKEGWLNLLKLQEFFHGNSSWKEVGVGVSWGGNHKNPRVWKLHSQESWQEKQTCFGWFRLLFQIDMESWDHQKLLEYVE